MAEPYFLLLLMFPPLAPHPVKIPIKKCHVFITGNQRHRAARSERICMHASPSPVLEDLTRAQHAETTINFLI
ncbi:hypothetical protein AAHE18_11G193800 [Arachis hypogaea]